MNSKMHNKLIQFEASNVGDQIGGETFVNGFRYPTLFGKKVVVTNKKRWNSVTINGESFGAGTDLVPDNMIYIFAPKPFLGKAYTLGDTQFFVDKKRNLITMEAWEHIAMGLANVNALGKIWISHGNGS
jgi:hypothetical protein